MPWILVSIAMAGDGLVGQMVVKFAWGRVGGGMERENAINVMAPAILLPRKKNILFFVPA